MAYLVQRPNGMWKAVVREPDGRRISRTVQTRKAAADWAVDQEDRIVEEAARGERAQ